MIARPGFQFALCGAAACLAAHFPATADIVLNAAEIRNAAPETPTIVAIRTASKSNAYFRVDIKATEQSGKLDGTGRLFFRWSSPGKGGDVVAEIDAAVGVEGTLNGDHVRIQVVSPMQLTYVVKQAPPPDPQVPLADQVHVGSTGEYPLSLFDEWIAMEAKLVNGDYEHQGPLTLPSGVWTVTTRIALAGQALVERLTVGGQVEAGDVFSVAVGETRVSIAATGSTPESVAAQLAAAWPEAAASTGIVAVASGSDVWLTAAAAENAFTCKIDTTEADGERSDGQTFASSTQFIAGGSGQGLWKKEVRHCGQLLGTFYSTEPSPTVGYFEVFICPVCRLPVRGGVWTKVR